MLLYVMMKFQRDWSFNQFYMERKLVNSFPDIFAIGHPTQGTNHVPKSKQNIKIWFANGAHSKHVFYYKIDNPKWVRRPFSRWYWKGLMAEVDSLIMHNLLGIKKTVDINTNNFSSEPHIQDTALYRELRSPSCLLSFLLCKSDVLESYPEFNGRCSLPKISVRHESEASISERNFDILKKDLVDHTFGHADDKQTFEFTGCLQIHRKS